MLTEVVASPTQANIDLLTKAAEDSGVLSPKPNYSLDGESYSWSEYQQALGKVMEQVRRQMIFAQGPFEVRSVSR